MPGFFFFSILASASVIYASLVAGAFFLALNLLGTVTDLEFFIKFKILFIISDLGNSNSIFLIASFLFKPERKKNLVHFFY